MKEEELQKENELGCNGVNGYEGYDLKERLICMNCRPGASWGYGYYDFCRQCFDKMCVQEVERTDLHKICHVYIQLIYSGKTYYEY
jgi:hypothetical protein